MSFWHKLLDIKNENGQALLIVILIMTIALTVGLSIASRTVTNLKTATEEAESQKALSAAEAGIEKALGGGGTAGGTFDTGSYTLNSTLIGNNNNPYLLNGGNVIPKDDGADIWFVSHNDDGTPNWSGMKFGGNVRIYWGKSSEDCGGDKPAAIEFVVVSGSSPYNLSRFVFDPCETSRNNNFTVPATLSNTVNGETFKYSSGDIVISNGLIGRVIPIYKETKIGIAPNSGTSTMPAQGTLISSTGTSGETKRKINVFKGYPKLPTELFVYSLLAP